MNNTVTLTGYLGSDPQIRETQERTVERLMRSEPLVFELGGKIRPDRAEDVCEQPAVYDAVIPSREYAVLSVATHSWKGGQQITTWHRIIVWNVDRMEYMGVRIARKGSRVEITGRKTTFQMRDGQVIEQIELSQFRVLQLK